MLEDRLDDSTHQVTRGRGIFVAHRKHKVKVWELVELLAGNEGTKKESKHLVAKS